MPLNRPERLNALSLALRAALAEHLDILSSDAGVRAIVIREPIAPAGADLEGLVDLEPGHPQFAALRAMGRCRTPLIAADRGVALGGGLELALQCDIIVTGRGARFGFPEVKVWIMPVRAPFGTQDQRAAMTRFLARRKEGGRVPK